MPEKSFEEVANNRETIESSEVPINFELTPTEVREILIGLRRGSQSFSDFASRIRGGVRGSIDLDQQQMAPYWQQSEETRESQAKMMLEGAEKISKLIDKIEETLPKDKR